MVYNFLGNPHKTEYEDIDEDFNILAEEFVDDQDSSDYEDEDDDYEEEEEDEIYDDDDDDEDEDAEDYWGLSDSDCTIDIDVPGPPDGGRLEANNEGIQKESTISADKEPSESKVIEDLSTVHRNLENNSET